jgi:hypothetical protein
MKSICAAAFCAAGLLAGAAQAQPEITGAVLPAARSVPLGDPATFLVTMVNSGDQTAINCGPDLTTPDPSITLRRFELDSGGAVIGTEFEPISIPAGESKSILLELTASSARSGALGLRFGCNNGAANYFPQINEISFTSLASGPVNDIIAVAATPSADGVVRPPAAGRRGLMTVAATYVAPGGAVGPDAALTVTPSAGDFDGQVELSVCETDAGGTCLAPAAASVDTDIPEGEPRFYAVFARAPADGGLPFLPDYLRVRLDFTDRLAGPGTAYVRASTSAAITSPAPGGAPNDARGVYRFRWVPANGDSDGFNRREGWIYVDAEGRTVGVVRDQGFSFPEDKVFVPEERFPAGNEVRPPRLSGLYWIFNEESGGTSEADLFLRANPAEAMIGQFLEPVFTDQKRGADAPNFTRGSDLNIAGVSLTQTFASGAPMSAATLNGSYSLHDPYQGRVTGSATINAGFISGSFVVMPDSSNQSCSLFGQIAPSADGQIAVLSAVTLSGPCARLSGQEFAGLAARRPIEELNGATGLHILLHPGNFEAAWPEGMQGVSLIARKN